MLLCELLGKTKQAYYKSQSEHKLLEEMREKAALDFVKEVRQQAPGIGLVKLWYMYNREDRGELRIGRDKFVRFMRANDLQVRSRSYRPRTTDSSHSFPVYPNLVRELIPGRPNQLWVSDITYWATSLKEDEKKFYYISFITDAYSHEIIGVDLSRSLSLEGPVRALDKALRRLKKEKEPLIHHSDRGCQYASLRYVKKLRKAGIMISMTENGDPKENAIAERVNGIIKNEILGKKMAGNFEEALKALNSAVVFYNTERPHMSCGMLTPFEAGQSSGNLGKKWRSYREEFLMGQQSL